MRFAFADPPYLGCCALYGHNHPEGPRPFDGRCWNDLETHRLLIDWLGAEFEDGWLLCLHAPSLRDVLPLCPLKSRVGAWVKPFASFKPNVNPAYAWEPIIWCGGRKKTRSEPTARDWLAENITLKRGLVGAKPPAFCRWALELLGWQTGDNLIDVFPGTGVMGRVVDAASEAATRTQLTLAGAP